MPPLKLVSDLASPIVCGRTYARLELHYLRASTDLADLFGCVLNGSAEAPVNTVSLAEEAVEGTESDLFNMTAAHGAKSERSIFCADRLNPFVEGVPVVTGEFRHGDGRKTSVEKFVVGIDALRVEILVAEFAGEH
jgi:hypothetical protein